MDLLNDKVWLVKVPEIVYNQMLQEKNLGTVDIYEKPSSTGTKENDLKLNLHPHFNPTNFDIVLNKNENFFTFKESKNKPLKIKRVNYFGRLVAADESSSDLVTLKVAAEENLNKPSVAIEMGKGRPKTEGIIQISVHQYMASSESLQSALIKKHRKDKNLKKTRMDKDDLKAEIFNLFNEQDYWTNKELSSKLDQPDNYLKEVLSEICDYIRSGPKKGYYELKRQYIRSRHKNDESSDSLNDNN